MDTPTKEPIKEVPKFDTSKMPASDSVKFGSFTIKPGDSEGAKKLVDLAKSKGYIIDKNGARHDTSSPSGKKVLMEVKALGEGSTPNQAAKLAEMQTKTGQAIAKGKAIQANKGVPARA